MEELDVQLPPFTVLYFEVTSSPYRLDSYNVNDPIKRIDARFQEQANIMFEETEEDIFKEFYKYVVATRPRHPSF
jgi:hypothetical protein